MRWKALLRPSWIGLTLAAVLFAVAAFTVLGPWQFDRHSERQEQNAAVERARESDPRPLDQVLPGGAAPDAGTHWSPVTVTGHYLPEAEVIARLRSVESRAAYEILTPLRTTDGEVVLVNRGYVRPDGAAVPDYAAPPPGEVTIIGYARIDEVDRRGRPAFADSSTGGRLHTHSVNSQVVADATDLDIRPGYFQLAPEQPGGLEPLPLPRTDAGPFLSYALQWIAFGVMALLGLAYFTARELKPGGVLHERRTRRKSVAQILAEDEADA